ncbi:NADPH-dependent FMN reductase [Pararobbsia silviterrae]|uniref:FMN reductase (NADPH) n=1 Tax=Pararobbsia silviterrae TaxID=1792498 RepID=A0A494X7S0_9BURK|nr:NADPH-dependent FMN reductase [Pararobbsia silviterrae]RKP44244.1 FMN reductase (NADPH) [Pararobbsia silviterrae]
MSYVVTISGSPSARSRSTHLLSAAETLLHARGIATRRIEPRDLPAEALLHADVAHPAIREALELVEHAKAVVIATPVYKVAYSGLLKTFLDLLPQTGLTGKLVQPIATGGSLAHLLALDYALKPVLSALGARHVLANVFATDAEVPSGESGYQTAACVAERLTQSIDAFGRVWFDEAELREHRERTRRVDALRAPATVGAGDTAQVHAPVSARCQY